jgi:hypothetical protein
MANIPVNVCLHPYTTATGLVTTNQTLQRGGLILVGQANPGCGGGPVYVIESFGGIADFDPATGEGKLINPPPPYGPRNYVRFDGARTCAQPNFDPFTLHESFPSPAYAYTCIRTDK